MKICIDARVIIDQQTGLGNYTYNLIKSLLEIDKRNFYVILVSTKLRKDHPLFFLEKENFIIVTVNISPVSVSQQFLLSLTLLKIKADVYHYPNWDIPIFHFTKSVFTIHDLTYLLHKDVYIKYSWLKTRYTHINILLGLKKASKVIVVSESTKKDLMHLFSVNPNKVEVIYESCEDIFSNKKTAIKSISSVSVADITKKYFLCVGERRPHKNLTRIINAFYLFNKRNKDHKLIIAGKAYANYDEPQNLIEKLHLKNDVTFYGYVTTEKLISLYKGAEALLFVSLYEGFGLPILEAMSCGVPVITSNISAAAEIAGDSAIKVNPYDEKEIYTAMMRVAEDRIYRSELIISGYHRVSNFSWLKTARQTLEIYEQMSEK